MLGFILSSNFAFSGITFNSIIILVCRAMYRQLMTALLVCYVILLIDYLGVTTDDTSQTYLKLVSLLLRCASALAD